MDVVLDREALTKVMHEAFDQVAKDFVIEEVRPMEVRVRLPVSERHLRPGGTVSGPTMFSLADVSVYLATMAMIGPVVLAVTTNISMDFMRKPAPGRLLCRMELLKLGRSLAVTEGRLFSETAPDKPVARASLTYSIPPDGPISVG